VPGGRLDARGASLESGEKAGRRYEGRKKKNPCLGRGLKTKAGRGIDFLRPGETNDPGNTASGRVDRGKRMAAASARSRNDKGSLIKVKIKRY